MQYVIIIFLFYHPQKVCPRGLMAPVKITSKRLKGYRLSLYTMMVIDFVRIFFANSFFIEM